MSTVRWKVPELLSEHGITAYQLGKEMGGVEKMGNAYRMANESKPPTRVELQTLASLIDALTKLTGKPIGLNDLLEYEGSKSVQQPL